MHLPARSGSAANITESPKQLTDENARRAVRILDCDVDNLAFEEALERLLQLARGQGPSYVVTPNVDHLLLLRRDAAFRAAYAGAALRLADGAPLLWAARLQGTPLRAKNSGSVCPESRSTI